MLYGYQVIGTFYYYHTTILLVSQTEFIPVRLLGLGFWLFICKIISAGLSYITNIYYLNWGE